MPCVFSNIFRCSRRLIVAMVEQVLREARNCRNPIFRIGSED